MENKEYVLLMAQEVQKEAQEYVQLITNANSGISYQDAINTFLYVKIAKLQYELTQLNTNINTKGK